MKKAVLLLLSVAMLFGLIVCSDDNGTNPPDEERDRPPIPEPTYYAGPVPTKSVEMVIETVTLGDYMPRVICASSPTPPEGYGYVPDSVYCSMDQSATHAVYPTRVLLMADDTVVTAPEMGFFIGGNGNPWDFYVPCNPLESQPYLQVVRYWVRVGDVERYAGGTTTTITRTTTRGTTETSASEFTKTLGIEASISGSWFVDFEVKIKTEFSWSESHETSIMQEESYEESFSIAAPEAKNIVYCVWQLVEEYRIVGLNGGDFTDPHYEFDPAYHTAACPTSELVPVTTYFEN